MAYTCKIELLGTKPSVWRTFQFHPDITFHQLHETIQEVMGWYNCHLYEFDVNGTSIGLLDPDDVWSSVDKDANKTKVSQLVSRKGAVSAYTYDFGDGWEHRIKLLDNKAEGTETGAPLCLDGAMNCPPEDVGGVYGYEHLLEVLAGPDDDEKEEMLDWLGEEFDPAYFSVADVNEKLQVEGKKLLPKGLSAGGKKPVKLTKSKLNNYLKGLEADELTELIKLCYDSSEEVKKLLAERILGGAAGR